MLFQAIEEQRIITLFVTFVNALFLIYTITHMENTPTSFEELFGVPTDTAQLETIDLQSAQNHLRSIQNYVQETRAIHDNTQWVDEIVEQLKGAQKQLRDVEVDHADKTEESYDYDTDDVHDILRKTADEKLFKETVRTYSEALRALKPYVDSTILKLNAAGKLPLDA